MIITILLLAANQDWGFNVPMRRFIQLLWAVTILPLSMIAFAIYVLAGFIWVTAFGHMADETRDPCERFGYKGSLERYKQRIVT